MLEGFQDQLVLSNLVNVYKPDAQTMERANNQIWRPMPYIAKSFDGVDQTANMGSSYTQLSVPTTIGYHKSVPMTLSPYELNDALQEKRLGDAAKQRLASDINVAVGNVVSAQGAIVVKRTTAATGFDDVAALESAYNERGIPNWGRNAAYTTRDYNGMASNLAARQTVNGKVQTAYERARVGENIANFDIYKLDYSPRLTAATATGVTINGANQYYTPRATSTAGTGETSNAVS